MSMIDTVEAAKAFLQEFLAAGPRESEAVYDRGAVNGFKKHHLRMASKQLGISRKQGTIYKALGSWCWMLPGVYNTLNLGNVNFNPTPELEEYERRTRTQELNS